MKTFDIHRFGKLLRWTVYYNKSTLTKITFGFFIAFLAIYLLTTDLLFSSGSSFPDRLYSAKGATLGVFVVFLFLTPSWILSNMKDRKSSLDYLMLPATNLEKFLARIVTVTIFYTLCVVFAQIAADLVQWIVSLFRYPISQTGLICVNFWNNSFVSYGGFTGDFDSYNGGNSSYIMVANILLLAWMVWMHSIYTLGGTVFRKRAWIITSFLLLVLGIIISFILFESSRFIEYTDNVYEVSTMAVGIIVTIILLLIAGINYFLSYRVFSRMQLINNKWINI